MVPFSQARGQNRKQISTDLRMSQPRKTRTEKATVDADKLARHAVTLHGDQRGMVRLRATPHDDRILLSTHTVADHADGVADFWFRRRADADKVLNEMVTLEAMPWKAIRVEEGVLLETSEPADAVIAECARWVWRPWQLKSLAPPIVSAAEIDERVATVKKDIDLCLVQLQVTGAMQRLNHEFKALRTRPRAVGEKFPSYKTWVTARLERDILEHALPLSLGLV
jgi:hypothetical protein